MKNIYLRGKHPELSIIVDDEDYDRLNKYKWYYCHGYAQRTDLKNHSHIFVHWDVIGRPSKGFVVDHINHFKLDNRKENLRHLDYVSNIKHREYSKNTDIKNNNLPMGVNWHKKRKKYQAQKYINLKKKWLGYFDTISEAKNAYLRA